MQCFINVIFRSRRKKAFTVIAEDGIWILVILGLWFTGNLFSLAAAWAAGRAVGEGSLQVKTWAELWTELAGTPGWPTYWQCGSELLGAHFPSR